MPCQGEDRIGPRALERGLDLLELVSARPEGLTFSDLVRELGLAKPVLSRLLKSLQERGMVVREPETRRYHRGPGLVRLAAGMEWAPDSRKAIAHHATPVLIRLRKRYEQSFLAVHWNHRLIECVATTVPEHGLATWSVGERHERLDRGPIGLCCAIYGGAEERLRSAETDEAVRLAQDRERIHLAERGWARFEGRRCHRLAAPLLCVGDRFVGALGCFAHPLAMEDYGGDELGAALGDAAREVSRLLGWQPVATAAEAPA